jgi:quercetin dioxygenase-like cupin family protein
MDEQCVSVVFFMAGRARLPRFACAAAAPCVPCCLLKMEELFSRLWSRSGFDNMEGAHMMEHAKTQHIAGLVEYQKGTVVSTTLIDKKVGTVTVFAFDKGQGLSEHTAPYDAMVCILDGKAEIMVAGKANLVAQGEMIIMPANKPHALKAVEQFKMMLIMIRA